MKALMYTAPNTVALRDIPEPQIDLPDGIKIRIDYCAMCATDVHIVTQGLYGHKPPRKIGHEACGTIVELTETAARYGFRAGDRVAVNPTSPCGCCPECKLGNDIFCQYKDTTRLGFTEYAVITPKQAFKIPENPPVDPMYYCLCEPCTCAVEGIDLAKIRIGCTVAISGVGGIGSILLNLILMRGGVRVTAIDPVPEKREMALAMGCGHVIDPSREDVLERTAELTGGRGFDVVFEASGARSAAPLMPKMIANKGQIVYFAVYPMDYELPLNLYELYRKEGSIQTVYTSILNFPRVMELLPHLQLDRIANKVMTLDQGVEAFELFQTSQYNKIILKCSGL